MTPKRPLVEVLIEDARWDEVGLEALAGVACGAVLSDLGLKADQFEISLMGCDDARIAGLNTEFRGKAGPTNVLSWPAGDLSAGTEGAVPELPRPGQQMPRELGDIAIAYETSAREAVEQGKPFGNHVTHLLVHGTLHLLGYDHIRDKDAALMEAKESRILASLGVPDPYR